MFNLKNIWSKGLNWLLVLLVLVSTFLPNIVSAEATTKSYDMREYIRELNKKGINFGNVKNYLHLIYFIIY